MAIEIKIPDFPESVSEGTLITWHKQVGDFVETDETILEVETDKIVLEVVAQDSGNITEILLNEGDTVTSAQVVGSMEAGAAKASSNKDTHQNTVSTLEKDPVSSDKISPAARNLINAKQLDSSKITATGNKGNITKEDVEKYIQQTSNTTKAPIENTQTISNPGARFEERVPLKGLRNIIEKRLVQSKLEKAMLTTFNEVNMEPVMTLRKK